MRYSEGPTGDLASDSKPVQGSVPGQLADSRIELLCQKINALMEENVDELKKEMLSRKEKEHLEVLLMTAVIVDAVSALTVTSVVAAAKWCLWTMMHKALTVLVHTCVD